MFSVSVTGASIYEVFGAQRQKNNQQNILQ